MRFGALIALIAAALGFIGVFTYLAMQFDYPGILDGSAAEVLPKLLATGNTGRAVWALYGFIPLLFMWVYLGLWDTLQGLVILFVGADVLILSLLNLRKRRRRAAEA